MVPDLRKRSGYHLHLTACGTLAWSWRSRSHAAGDAWRTGRT
jgi:hypothetical protein